MSNIDTYAQRRSLRDDLINGRYRDFTVQGVATMLAAFLADAPPPRDPMGVGSIVAQGDDPVEIVEFPKGSFCRIDRGDRMTWVRKDSLRYI